MVRRVRPNVPEKLHGDDREVLGFLQAILDYEESLIPVGGSIKYVRLNPVTLVLEGPNARFLAKTGQTVSKADYPDLWDYAQTDAAYVTTATTVTIPNDPGFIVRVR
jgi:hypothetical protein